MERDDIDLFEQFVRVYRRLRLFADSGYILVVEGKRDKDALEKLGIMGHYIYASRLLVNIRQDPELWRDRKFVLLVDYDSYGWRLFKNLRREIQRLGGVFDESVRSQLHGFRGFPEEVEAFPKWLYRNLSRKELEVINSI